MKMLIWITLAILSPFFLIANAQGTSNCQIVTAAYQSLGGISNSTDCCVSIPGVTCFGDQVTKLNWDDSKLSGPFPANLNLLTELTEL